MSQIVLLDGGDGGGILITSTGVRRIPPFEPSIGLHLQGLSALLNGIRLLPNAPIQKMITLVNRVSNIFIEQVEAVVEPLDGEHSLIYQDEDSGGGSQTSLEVELMETCISHRYLEVKILGRRLHSKSN